MSQAPAAPLKVCVLCKQDVSKKPRVKDPQGRYLCEPCFDQSQKKTQALEPRAAKPAPSAPPDPMFDAVDNGAGADMMLPEGYDPSLVLAAATDKPPAPIRVQQPTAAPAGKDGKKAAKKGKSGPQQFLCRHCGYDMSRGTGMRCPECGRVNMQPKDQGLLDDERAVKAAMYRRPLVLMAVGWVISIAALAIGGVGPEGYIMLAVGWLFSVPIGVVTFFVCTLMFLEYDSPWHVTAMRLAGIYACVGVADAIALAVGFNAFSYASIGLLILLYMTELEMEKWEAVLMAVVGFVVKVILGIALFFAIAFAMGGNLPTALTGGAGTNTAGGTTVPLVSAADPKGTIYIDDDGDGKDDLTGAQVPSDAVPMDSLNPTPTDPADGAPTDEDTDGGD